jgi:hypothetical protein
VVSRERSRVEISGRLALSVKLHVTQEEPADLVTTARQNPTAIVRKQWAEQPAVKYRLGVRARRLDAAVRGRLVGPRIHDRRAGIGLVRRNRIHLCSASRIHFSIVDGRIADPSRGIYEYCPDGFSRRAAVVASDETDS